MARPRFSIVIPTRERADTLRYTLQTCLVQQFPDYEIVVGDNCSSPATKQAVDACESPRIRYVRSDRALSMSENWELAVSHATGEYVIVIGDDDGLLPDALEDIDCLLRHTKTRALRWERVYYSWPNIPVPDAANIVHIPLIRKNEVLDGNTVIKAAANYRTDYTLLPMLYNSAIHADLIMELKSRIGRVFLSRTPDVFSGFAFAYLAGSYVSIGRPMSINAGSAKSNGVAHMHLQGNSPVAQEFQQLNDSSGLRSHPKVADIIAMPAALADSFQHAKDMLFSGNVDLCLDRQSLVVNCLQSMKMHTATSEVWTTQLQEIRRSLADDKDMLAWFDAHHAKTRFVHESVPARKPAELGFDGHTLHLNATEFGVTDVMGVAQLSARLLGRQVQLPTLEKPAGAANPMSLYRRMRTAARVLIKGR